MEYLALWKNTNFADVVEDDEIGSVNKKLLGKPDLLTKHCFEYYQKNNNLPKNKALIPVDLQDCQRWVWEALNKNNGQFHPFNREIVDVEKYFDFELDESWAQYNYKNPYNKKEEIKGNLALKGTVDLVTKVNNKTYEVIDYKFGKRQDFVTGAKKTFDYLQKDLQLLLYYKACSKIYPQIEHFIFTMFFVNDGGAISPFFYKKDLNYVDTRLKEIFAKIQQSQRPKLLSENNESWKCKYCCQFSNNKYFKDKVSDCKFIQKQIQKQGINETIKQYHCQDFLIDKYKAPGSVE